MKTFVLTISMTFPSTHPKKGKPTNFKEKIYSKEKIHTLRANYALWLKRITKIQNGEAFLSIRQWTGKPYYSQQKELFKLGKHDVGIQKLENPDNFLFAPIEGKLVDWGKIAENDGLSFEDFCEWFKVRSSEPMAIIHFSDFRY
jgi:hypothetical protein